MKKLGGGAQLKCHTINNGYTSGNGNISFGSDFDPAKRTVVSIAVTNPGDYIGIPYLYTSNQWGGHFMSCLASQTVLSNSSVKCKVYYFDHNGDLA